MDNVNLEELAKKLRNFGFSEFEKEHYKYLYYKTAHLEMFGLELRRQGILTHEGELQTCMSPPGDFWKNKNFYSRIVVKDDPYRFLLALKETCNFHIINFIQEQLETTSTTANKGPKESCVPMQQETSMDTVTAKSIIAQAVVEYSSQMDAKVNEVTSKDVKVIVELNKQVVKKIITDIKLKNSISEDLEQMIELRLKNSLMIYVNKYILQNSVKNVAVGIHLGTTCCVAIQRGDQVEVIRDNSGNALIPSYVCFHEDGVRITKVGKAAKDESHLYPEHTIFDAKRLIGKPFSDAKVQEYIKTCPFQIVNRGGRTKIRVQTREYNPEDISAHILKHVKNLASAKLGFEVTKAVITVPANFDDRQRDATRQAAQIAGLEVLQIINEPTAAAVAYKLNNCQEDKHILVVDLSGSTFDATILKSSGAELQVLTTIGENRLGSEAFVYNMVLYCVDNFEAQHGIKLLHVDFENYYVVKRLIRRLKGHCEDAKDVLSKAESATVNVDAITKEGLDLSVTITKSEFENMNMHLFQKCIDIVSDAIKKVGLLPGEIDDVLMVGGSSETQKIKELLKEYLGIRSLAMNDEVDNKVAMALGAASQACILSEGSSVLRFISPASSDVDYLKYFSSIFYSISTS